MSQSLEQLKECPFCGKKPDLDDDDTLYPSGTGWKWDEELGMRTYHNVSHVPREQWCWGMHCPTNSGGCGCEVHGDSKEEAIEKWNRRAHADALERLAERDAELARLKGQLVEQKAIIEALMAGSMVASDEGVIPVIRRIELLQEQLALAYDAINDALPWMIKLGDYIGNGTQADPMGRCNAITKMRIAVEMRDD